MFWGLLKNRMVPVSVQPARGQVRDRDFAGPEFVLIPPAQAPPVRHRPFMPSERTLANRAEAAQRAAARGGDVKAPIFFVGSSHAEREPYQADAVFGGDGAYDRDDVYREVGQRHPDAAVIVPPRSSAVPSATAETAPTKRDRHLQLIAERGRMGWQRASGYNWRALVEADIGRYKRVISDALRSRTGGRQTTEVAIAVASLNRMLELGRPEYVRLT
jgi:hypothetical protein